MREGSGRSASRRKKSPWAGGQGQFLTPSFDHPGRVLVADPVPAAPNAAGPSGTCLSSVRPLSLRPVPTSVLGCSSRLLRGLRHVESACSHSSDSRYRPRTAAVQDHPIFAAIDFETADHRPTSACALGLVVVACGRIVQRIRMLIDPGKSDWTFFPIHGINAEAVRGAARFAAAWNSITSCLSEVHFFAAHNAAFDQRVLDACCRAAALHPPTLPFVCTMRLARDRLGIRPSGLAVVSQRLGIPLAHHEPLSDAEAAAHITLAAIRTGWRWTP
jgi:DNA polymerase-3 subunit epsilon